MQVSALRRWHWILIALVVGLIGGSVRQATVDFEDRLDAYGKLMTSQRRFEEALVGQVQGVRQLKDITVYPYRIRSANGSRRLVHIVAARYWNGEAVMDHGQLTARFLPCCYLATVPYKPLDGGTPGTILDYLEQLHKSSGVQYRYAWWWWMLTPMALWVSGSLLVIGGIWPTVVNLLAFGTLRRPREERGVSLRNVKAPPAPQRAVAAPAASYVDELDRELQETLAVGSGSAGETEQAPAPKVLASGPLEPLAAPAAADDREFGADKDDFYPTERHRPPPPHP